MTVSKNVELLDACLTTALQVIAEGQLHLYDEDTREFSVQLYEYKAKLHILRLRSEKI